MGLIINYKLPLILISFLLVGCVNHDNNIDVVTSIKPLFLISSEFANSSFLISPTTNPHYWEPTPDSIHMLQSAKLYIKVGSSFEVWDADFKKPKTISMTNLTTLIDNNPHVWLDPDVAKILAKKIYGNLSNNSNKSDLNNFIKCVDRVDKSILSESIKANITYVAYNPAFTYFANHFKLNQILIITNNVEPSINEYNHAKEIMLKKKIHLIFINIQMNDAIAQKLAKETNATVVHLDPLATNEDNYCDFLRNFWQTIKTNANIN